MRAPLTLALSLIVLAASNAADWISDKGFRYRDIELPANGRTHLTEIPASQTGIAFRSDVNEERGIQNSIRLAGTGAAAGDIDGDGLCDLFFSSMGGKCALYKNLGNWKFVDITDSAGVACEGQDSTGAALADIDGDGDLDLLVNSIGGGTRLFLNDGKGHFTESPNCGLARRGGSISMALADVDGNGTLDLFVVNYAATKIEDHPTARIDTRVVNNQLLVAAIDGVPTTSPELTNRYFVDASHTLRELGEVDTLYLNDGHGKFTPVSWTDGAFLDENGKPLAAPPHDWGLSAMFRDMNGDGAPDLYVCNDLFTPDRIWINDGHGHFRAIPTLAIRQTSLFSMGIDFADINRDGFDDFFVVDMLDRSLINQKIQTVGVSAPELPIGQFDNRPQYKRNTLFLNRGDNTYAEIGQLAGLEATGWSWSPVFLDIDLDGYEDLLISAGYYRDALNADIVEKMKNARGKRKLTEAEYRELKKMYPPLPQQNKTFRNRRDLTFEDKTKDWGFDFFGISQGICLADLDNDGDLDVILIRQNGPVAIYKNESTAPRIAVRLKSKMAIGSKIQIRGAAVPQSQEMISAGRYLCSDDPIRPFAAGNEMNLEVTWRNGTKTSLASLKPNRIYEIDDSTAFQVTPPVVEKFQPLFEDASDRLAHQHIQDDFDDFGRQPTLHTKLFQRGPPVAWSDMDGDGLEDLIIGASKGGSVAFFHNNGDGSFKRLAAPAPATRDCGSLIGLGGARMLMAFSNYQDSQNKSAVRLIANSPKSEIHIFPGSAGALAVGDIDADGELDVFIAGHCLPGAYPKSGSSYLLQNKNGDYTLAREFKDLGLVNGAIFSDLDNDGFPELILACEWGPIRVFKNDHGKLTESTTQLGLANFTGLWHGLAAGDFDGDGKLDFVAANLGRNTKFEHYRRSPLRIYYADQGSHCWLASHDDDNKWRPHALYTAAMRALVNSSDRFPTQTAFANASIEELLANEIPNPKFLEAAVLESTVFLNRGDHFETAPLPIEAQFAPAFGVCVADFDGDGAEDIFLAQNNYAVDNATARSDAGRGLLLKGRGDGHFDAMPGQTSGIKLYGEQRACAACDYDRDGRTDLVVTQNGAATVLLHNKTAAPGLRLNLHGPSGNPNAIGAIARINSPSGKPTPARAIHAGSGYLSQDSPNAILHLPPAATTLTILWPGGATNTYPIPKDASSLDCRP